MVIGLFILAGVVQVLVDGKRGYSTQRELSYLQSNARVLKEMLSTDIKNAGDMGCMASITNILSTLKSPAGDEYDIGDVVGGSEYVGSAWVPALAGEWTGLAGLDTGSDILALGGIYGGGDRIAKAMPNTSADLKVTSPASFEKGDIIFVTDCKQAAITNVTNMTAASSSGWDNLAHNMGAFDPGNSTKDLGAEFGTDASVYQFQIRRYYIADSNITSMPSLWRKINLRDADELVSGVESMQIEYGVDTTAGVVAGDPGDGSVNRYMNASDIVDKIAGTVTWIGWDRVTSVRVNVVLRSENIVHPSNVSVTLDGINYNDRFLRQRVSFTTRIRNRGLN
jgi:type IV pilus assembly protein PilW